MKVSAEEVDRIAELAKLEFSDAEREAMRADLSKILGFIDKLNELDTDDVEPLLFMTDEVNVLRKDEPKDTVAQKDALKNAPLADSDYFKIKKVLDK